MHVALSFPSTNFKDYLDFRRQNDKLLDKGIFGAKIPKPKPTGGKMLIVDWKQKNVVWEKFLPTPSGFIFHKDKLIVCDEIGDRVISVDKEGRGEENISHPLINYPHDIVLHNGNYLVTSTGLDIILEFNRRGKLKYRWSPLAWGYDKTPEGEKRIVDYEKDHRGIRYATLAQTTHINSAIYYDDRGEKLLSTFFHQGQLVLINRSTGEPQIILENLDHPHAIHKGIDNTFILSETGENKIYILDNNLKVVKIFQNIHGCEWIQDAIFTQNGTIMIGDANRSRILEVSYPDFKLICQYKYDPSLKLFKILDLHDEDIQQFLS